MDVSEQPDMIELPTDQPFFETFYAPAPLVIVGTRESDGTGDLAPKHMAMPLGWSDFFGFVCSPEHRTYTNAVRTGEFTVSYPAPEDILDASLAAGPREQSGEKPSLEGIDTIEGRMVDVPVVAGAYGVLECEVLDVVDGFDGNALVAGAIVGKYVATTAYRSDEVEPERLLENSPVLAYLYPDRYACISETNAFPFPKGFQR